IGHYVINLLVGMQEIDRLNHFRLVANPEAEKVFSHRFPDACVIGVTCPPALRLVRWKEGFFRHLYFERRSVPKIHKRGRSDLLFHPHIAQSVYTSKSTKTVVMVHDLYLKHFPNELSKRYLAYLDATYRKTLLNADHIITPSHFVKQDILTHYPNIPDQKITPIHNPIVVRLSEVSEIPIDKPYILSVNAIRFHKNLMTLIKAFEQIQDKIDHSLVLTGPVIQKEINLIQTYIKEKKIPRVVVTGYVTDAQRNYLYHNSSLFVSPSLHEGFGITPVEAALFEVPVLTTRETSIPEITRNLLHYYDPATDHHQLARKILEVLGQDSDREKLRAIRDEFQIAYSASSIAQQYWECFQHVVERS
ncbi:MAG: glycosyltransferase family 4 protein, partial [Methanomethylovorans sp.]|nr:glycosyltransferase family 4 protein [Methanomethylovorans sp.]